MLRSVIGHAKSSFLALANPYQSVEKVFPQIINGFNKGEVKYVGIKNKHQIPRSLMSNLMRHGYDLHTIDRCSIGGRAVDINMKNPISGLPMTGSSSGTAVNVLLGINDLGIGTDGGGSVLAPAMSVNLFGFISPLIEKEHVRQFESLSTDNIPFHVSIGFIAREISILKEAVSIAIPNVSESSSPTRNLSIITERSATFDNIEKNSWDIRKEIYPDILGDRQTLIPFLRDNLKGCDMLISQEGPIDYIGMGDTLIGHFDELTKMNQRNSKKGLIRVVNMANATALVVPKKEFASGYVLICESTPTKISKLFEVAEKISPQQDGLISRYFQNIDSYFEQGF